jgi:hypothetical protein
VTHSHIDRYSVHSIVEYQTLSFDKIQNIVHVFCLAHVLQLALQTFLRSVRVNSTNDELQKNWNDQKNIKTIDQAAKDLFLTLTKIIKFILFLFLFKSDFYWSFY